jgi:hypothetical protein
MTKYAYVCPGPGDNRRCVDRGRGTPRGGRCAECRKAAMKIWAAKAKGRPTPKLQRTGRRPKSLAAKAAAQRHAEEIAKARSVKADLVGPKGAEKLINDWLKQP